MDCFLKRISVAGLFVLLSLLFAGGQVSFANELETLPEHWIWPTDGVITDTYGSRHGHHHGIDIAGEYGSPIYAVDAGVVSKSYYSGSYGHVVFIKHENNFETVYAHMSSRQVVEGQQVEQGEIIGLMGSTGRSSGVHLHFEVHKSEWTINKENSINPSHVLGDIHIGETVEVMLKEAEPAHGLVDMITMAQSYTEINHVLYSDYQLLKEGVQEGSEQLVATASVEIAENEPMEEEEVSGQENTEVVYVIEKGDTLWDIAEAFQTSVHTLMEANRLQTEVIHPGQKIIVHPNVRNKYIVKKGDTLTSIARITNVPVESIKKINQLDSDVIYPEQILLVDG